MNINRTQIAKQNLAPKARVQTQRAFSKQPKDTFAPQRDTFVDNLKQFAMGAAPGYGLLQMRNEAFTEGAPGAAAGVTLGQAFGGPFLAMGALMMSAGGFNAGIVGVGVGVAASIAAGISYASVDHAMLQSPETEIMGTP